tara:strand:+ start:1545 stop:1946 length:402 start_codon:yes stop_codon:yes gene_type:complete
MDILGVGKLVGSVINGIGDRRSRKYELEKTIDMKKIEAAAAIDSSVVALQLAQIEVNKAEAASRSFFVAGWRPFIGWTCGFALLYNVIFSPLLEGLGYQMPVVDASLLYPVLLGMLGLGGMRSFDKKAGSTAK